MPFDRDYWTRLATEAGLPKEQVEAIAGNERLMTALSTGYKRQDEFSREMDAARRAQQEAEQLRTTALADYQKLTQWYSANKDKLDLAGRTEEYQRRVAAYEALHGPLNGAPNGNGTPTSPPQGLTQEQVNEMLLQGQRNVWNTMRQVSRVKERYAETFGKPMPESMVDELEAMAAKPENNGRSATDLYNDYIGPKVEEHRATQQKEREARIREEALKEGYAKGAMREPTADNPENVAPFYAKRPDPKTDAAPDERAIMSNFVQTVGSSLASP